MSLVLILATAVLLCLVAAGVAFGAAGIFMGWHNALGWLADLQSRLGSDAMFIQRLSVAASLLCYVALCAAVLGAARWRGGRAWAQLVAWRPWDPFARSRLFWIVVGATIAYSLAADVVISRLYPPSNSWVTLPDGVLWVGLFVVLAVVLAPLAEELLFRGWLYTGLRARFGAWTTTIVTGILFAVAHWEKTHIYAVAVFPVGLALGFARERTGSIRASMTFHMIYNGAATVLLLLAI